MAGLSTQERAGFRERGFVVVRRALSPDRIATYRCAADRAVAMARAGLYARVRWTDAGRTDFAGVNDVLYPDARSAGFIDSLSDPSIMGPVADLVDGSVRYRICTLLVNSIRYSYAIGWHRDLPPPPGVDEIEHLERTSGIVQLNGALVDDTSLWIVPGSHRREATDSERVAMSSRDHSLLPGEMQVVLNAGDVAFYNPCLIHRAANRPGRLRRTLHYAFESSAMDSVAPAVQPWIDAAFVDSLPEPARPMFHRWFELMRSRG
ncbi:phytanoyl-CoA dioxygenase family protein [Candidatus Poribacteria bacterium]|nr:phytanoyl-CoA dioxygenase family protein [Candidatus Poribacteria bacterium]